MDASKSRKILVVDDELDILESVKMLIETLGCGADVTTDGNKAVEMLKKDKYDLVLLDMLMPKISGMDTLLKIRADSKLKDQKVAFLTVVGLTPEGKDTIKKLKIVAYIEKPIDNTDFKKKIKEILKI